LLLRYFRINDPYRLAGLAVLALALYLPQFLYAPPAMTDEVYGWLVGEQILDGRWMYIETIDDTAPLTSLLYAGLDAVFGRWVAGTRGLALTVWFFLSALFSVTLIRNHAFPENTYVPALLIVLLSFFSFDTLSLTGTLLSQIFLLFALNRLMAEVGGGRQGDEGVLTLGVLLSLASLSDGSGLLYFPGTIFLLMMFTRTSVRRYFLLVFGFVLPHALLISMYYLKGGVVDLYRYYYANIISVHGPLDVPGVTLLTLAVLPGLYLLLSLFVLTREARYTKYQSQLVQVMLVWLLMALAQGFVSKVVSPHAFLGLVAPTAFFITHFLLLIRRRKIASAFLVVFAVAILALHYAGMSGRVVSVSYEELFPAATGHADLTGKRVWAVNSDPGVFLQNRNAGPFLNSKLSRHILDGPHSYRNLLTVHRVLETDMPEIILDPDNRLEEFFRQLPVQAVRYRREGELYVRISP
jgi:hypothetical protein